MSQASFVQIHTLTSYPASLLNRDDVGFAKRIPFGGVTRTRISSQCLKRHWRTFEGDQSLSSIEVAGQPVQMSVRSRLTFEQRVRLPLQESGVPTEMAAAITADIMARVLGESARAKAEKDAAKEGDAGQGGKAEAGKGKGRGKAKAAAEGGHGESEAMRTGQVTVLGAPELDYLLGVAREMAVAMQAGKSQKEASETHFGKEASENLRHLVRGAGLDASLFGRMVTSDALARGDAAVHVAHAFTVHKEASESDYFSAVDDLLGESGEAELGSGHIGSVELTTGLYYGYVAVDVPLLVSNLEGCRRDHWSDADKTLAAEVLRRLVHLVATVSPGAKLGSTAPHARASLVMVEFGSAQPRTLANGFLAPVPWTSRLAADAYSAMALELRQLDAMYGKSEERRIAGLGALDSFADVTDTETPAARNSLRDVGAWLATKVQGA